MRRILPSALPRGLMSLVAVVVMTMSAGALNTAGAVETGGPSPGGFLPAGDAQRKVAIDFNDVDIRVFIKFISELTDRNFVVDPAVKGRVTVVSPTSITIDEAYKVFESVLEVHGFGTVVSGEITKITRLPNTRTQNVETRLEAERGPVSDRIVTQIVPLTYADPEDLRKLLTPLVAKSSIILAYTPTNTLIITDHHSNVQRLLKIIETVDVDEVGREIAVIPLEQANAADVESVLSSVFRPVAGKPSRNLKNEVLFVADERTNAIIFVGHLSDMAHIRELVGYLDRELPQGRDNVHVVYLKNADAESLAEVLVRLQEGSAGGDQAQKAVVVSKDMKITADRPTNSLIIQAKPRDFNILETIIEQLDIPRPMVYIECLIMEVDIQKDFELGTEWQAFGKTTIDSKESVVGGGFSGGDAGNQFSTLNQFTGLGTLPAGTSLGVFTEAIDIAGVSFNNLSAVIAAFKKDKDVHILSTPQVLTTDNEEAKIVVGKNIPFQTQSSTTDNNTFNSFEYRDVGTTLAITPQINQGDLIRLEIAYEISKLESTQDFRPTTLKRTIDTTVVVENSSTVVIGGLIDDNLTVSDYKVPFLGDLPFLGWLFKSEGRSTERTNLYIFLTPRVVKHPKEAVALYDKKRGYIDTLKSGRIKLYQESMTFPPELQETPDEMSTKPIEPAPEAGLSSPFPKDTPTGDADTAPIETEAPARRPSSPSISLRPDTRYLPGFIGEIGMSR